MTWYVELCQDGHTVVEVVLTKVVLVVVKKRTVEAGWRLANEGVADGVGGRRWRRGCWLVATMAEEKLGVMMECWLCVAREVVGSMDLVEGGGVVELLRVWRSAVVGATTCEDGDESLEEALLEEATWWRRGR